MKGINVKETLAAVGAAVMGFGTVAIQVDLVKGALLLTVGLVVFYFRGYLK